MAGNIHSINQDNVLGGDDEELSPNEFGNRNDDDHEAADDPPTSSKKKSGQLPLIGGIIAAVAIVGGFGWKILSPHFGNDRGGNDREVYEQIASSKPQPFALEPAAPQAAATMPAPMPAPAVPGQANPAQSGVAVVPPAMPETAPKLVSVDKPVVTPQPVQASPAGAEEIAQINKRIDGISTALSALKETVEKLQSDMKSHAQAKPAPAVAASPVKPASPPVAAKKPAPATPAAKKPAEGSKSDVATADAKPTIDLQLQAVLQDRAWFKTKTGETITVSAGEEVKGVGVVKQIDADGGRVVFTNGMVYR